MRCTAFEKVCPAVRYAESCLALRLHTSYRSDRCRHCETVIAPHNDTLFRKPSQWRQPEKHYEELRVAI
jgi:hypothetical protein